MILAKLKMWAFICAGYVLMALSIVLLKKRGDRAKAAAERYKAKAHRQNTIMKKQNEHEQEFRSRRADAKREIDAGRGSPIFRDPNILFNDKNDSE